jgi:hypothetical protein
VVLVRVENSVMIEFEQFKHWIKIKEEGEIIKEVRAIVEIWKEL